MDPLTSPILVTLLLVFISSSISLATSTSTSEKFFKCMSSTNYSDDTTPISKVLYTPTNSSFTPILRSSLMNLRFLPYAKPSLIMTPTNYSHIQAAVLCSQKNGLQIKVRSGGHDYEGLSYRSDAPFILVDLRNIRSISVDTQQRTAWVQAGSTLGEVYYHIANKSNTLGFPAGLCSTVGVGGHLSGGGIGTLMRKYGLAVDSIIDAYIVDARGRVHDRKSMGEDLFWAIRGGGGASFGIIVSWKLKLVPVPATVTVFNVTRTLEQGATKLVTKWQQVAYNFPEELFIRALAEVVNGSTQGGTTIRVAFQCLFLGRVKELLPLMQKRFPELGLEAKDCIETSWVNAAKYSAGFTKEDSIDVILDRSLQPKLYYKAKSDYLQQPMSETGLEGLWKVILTENITIQVIFDPLGGRLNQISDSETPYPHRAGNLYNIQYYMYWGDGGTKTANDQMDRLRKIYMYMTPFVSKSPRSAFFNYKDLDLGQSHTRNTSYTEARAWGYKYFKHNFRRLASVKKMADPTNFFWNEQGIPPLDF